MLDLAGKLLLHLTLGTPQHEWPQHLHRHTQAFKDLPQPPEEDETGLQERQRLTCTMSKLHCSLASAMQGGDEKNIRADVTRRRPAALPLYHAIATVSLATRPCSLVAQHGTASCRGPQTAAGVPKLM